jgi:hypothetical protein
VTKPVDVISLCQSHEVFGYCAESACELCGCRARLKQEMDKLSALYESFQQPLSDEEKRLRMMAEDNGQTWDLSFNDQSAILWVLDALKYRTAELGRLTMRKKANAYCTCEHGLTSPGCPVHDKNKEL